MPCFTCVDHNTVQVIEECGRFNMIADSGCHWLNCFCGQLVRGKLSMRVQQIDVAVETKTSDNVFVTVVVSVQFQVIKQQEYQAFYSLTDTQRQIKAYVFDVVRSTVPAIKLDETFVSKDNIAVSVKNELAKSMKEFGYEIIQTLVTDIAPDNRVKHAMNAINASERARHAAYDKAEAEKIMVVKAAEADAEAKFLAGTGIARQRQAIINGLRESVSHFQDEIKDVKSNQVMDLMLVTQYFDMLKDVGINANKASVFIPHGPGAIADTAEQLRHGLLVKDKE